MSVHSRRVVGSSGTCEKETGVQSSTGMPCAGKNNYRLTVDQRRRVFKSMLTETEQRHQFYAALYGTNWRWSELDKPNSVWIVRLIDDNGNGTAPEEITRIRKPGAIDSACFPYTSPLRHVSRIRFPVVSEEGQPTISKEASGLGFDLRVYGGIMSWLGGLIRANEGGCAD